MSNRLDTTTTTVIYRTGGWANAEWHKTTPINTTTESGRREFDERLASLRRMGYKAFGVSAHDIVRQGLPMGWCRHADSETGRMTAKNCDCE